VAACSSGGASPSSTASAAASSAPPPSAGAAVDLQVYAAASLKAAVPALSSAPGSSGRISATFIDRPTAARTSPPAGPTRTTTVLALRRIRSMLAARPRV